MVQRRMPEQHFTIAVPLATHWGPATCEDVDCPHYLLGWQTIVPNDGPEAAYIRGGWKRYPGRTSLKYTEELTPEGLVCFTFEAGQTCFRQHIFQNGRPPIFAHQRPAGEARVLRPLDFNDAMNEEVYKVNKAIEEG